MDFFQSIAGDQPFFRVVFPHEREENCVPISNPNPRTTKQTRTKTIIRQKQYSAPLRKSDHPNSHSKFSTTSLKASSPGGTPPKCSLLAPRLTNQEFLDSLRLPLSEPISCADPTRISIRSSAELEIIAESPMDIVKENTTVSCSTAPSNLTNAVDEPIHPKEGLDETRNFLDLIYKGKLSQVKSYLQRNPKLNLNCLAKTGGKRYRNMCRTDGWGGLHFCAWLNNVEIAKYLLSLGCDVNLVNKWEQAPLHIAICRGSFDMVTLLVSNGANVNQVIQRRHGQLPIHIACIVGRLDIAAYLLEKGARNYEVVDNESGPQSCLQFAIRSKNVELARLFVALPWSSENGFDPVQLAASKSSPEMFSMVVGEAARVSHVDSLPSVLPHLLKYNDVAYINALMMFPSLLKSYFSNYYGSFSILTNAVQQNALHFVEFLVQEKIDAKNNDQALLMACFHGHLEIAEFLLSNGANKNYQSYFGNTYGESSLHVAARNGRHQIIEFLISQNVDLEPLNSAACTPLIVAVNHGKVDIVKLLAPVCKIHATDSTGQTPLHIAAGIGNVDIIRILHEHGADMNSLNVKRQGITPLHSAASAGRNEAIAELVRHGADINQRKTIKQGPQTALEMARASGHKLTEKVLKDLGATEPERAQGRAKTAILLDFADSVPQSFQYPKSYSLSEINTSGVHNIVVDDSPAAKAVHSPTQSAQWKTVRLFISSTFTDMQAERNYLIKHCIPVLRKKCAARRVHLVEVDLRWGITLAESTSGNTLDICLSEVDNCQIFVGLLGERYGWVPSAAEVRDDVKIRYDWREGLSVTALEIYRGALKRQHMDTHASFYFRTPESIKNIPNELRKDFCDSNVDRLKALKTEIKSSKYKVVEYATSYAGQSPDAAFPMFTGLDAFGEKFIENVWSSIDALYPTSLVEPSELEQEQYYHDQLIEHRIANFIGRKDKLKEIEKYVKSTDKKPFVISGQAGSGKSAIMGYFAHQQRERSSNLLFYHFVGASPHSTSIVQYLRRACQCLIKEAHLWTDFDESLDDYDKLIEKFGELLVLVSKAIGNKKFVIIVDAINQFTEDRHRASLLHWLPKTLPNGIRFIVSTLECDSLNILKAREYPIMEIGQLINKDRENIVSQTLALYNKKLDSNQMKLLLAKQDVFKPLYLVICCEELRLYGSFEKLEQKITALSPTLQGVLEQVLVRIEQEHGAKSVADVLSVLECSRGGLLEVEIVGMLALTSAKWAAINMALGLFLRSMGKEAQLDFFHRQISKAVRKRYLQSDLAVRECHARMARYYLAQCDPQQDWQFDQAVQSAVPFFEPYPRAVSEVCYHMCCGGLTSNVLETLSSLRFIQRRALNNQAFSLVHDFNLLEEKLGSVLSIEEKSKLSEFRQFVTTKLPQLTAHPRYVYQFALNQNRQRIVATQAADYLASNQVPYIEWKNRVKTFESSYVMMFQASSDVNDCKVSMDEKYILSAQKDGSLSLWSTATGEEIVKHSDHKDRVNGCAFSRNGLHYLSCASDGRVNIYQVETKQLMKQFENTSGANGCSFSPNSMMAAVGYDDNSLAIYSLSDFSLLKTLAKHTAPVNCVAWSPSGSQLVSGSTDKSLIVWDVATGRDLLTLAGHTKPVRDCHWTSDRIFSCSQDKTLRIWSAQTGRLEQELTGHKDNVEACAVSPSEQYVASSSWDRTARLWERNYNCLYGQVGAFPGSSHFVNAICFFPTSDYVVTGSPDHTIKVYQLDTAKVTAAPSADSCKIHSKIIRGIDYSASKELVLTASWDKSVKLLNADQNFRTLNTFNSHSKRANEARFTSDGKYFISCSMDQTAKLIDIESKQELISFQGHELNVFSLDISYDDKYLVTASADKTIKLWDIESGELIGTLSGHSDWVTAVRFSPYSRRILSGSRDKTIKVWDSESGELLETLEQHGNTILQLRYSDDGKYFCSASEDRTVKVWDAHTLELKTTLVGHTNEVTCCKFLRNSSYVVSGSSDNTVRIWDSFTGEERWVYYCDGGILGLESTKRDVIVAGDSSGLIYGLTLNNIRL